MGALLCQLKQLDLGTCCSHMKMVIKTMTVVVTMVVVMTVMMVMMMMIDGDGNYVSVG